MMSRMKPVDGRTGDGGSRIAIVFNGSPLFTGDAGSGESEIRGWIIGGQLASRGSNVGLPGLHRRILNAPKCEPQTPV